MNEALQKLFLADQEERVNHPEVGTLAYESLRQRDQERRKWVQKMVEEKQVITAQDYYHAALIFQHGDTIDEIWMAHLWALTSVELGNPAGKWLAAAALDRWHMYQGQPQKYGTQMVPDGIRYRLWDIDPATTDEERAQWDVPSLAEMEQRARQLTSANQGKIPPLDKAPEWLKQAIEKWNKV
ncbi:hypothetical protein [Siphonobacter sp. SORGH_AS_0500]|uniref:hypothetical protein n=1 Tax=Siphonobacter sp. SORGH_AS_0500 TaxID=1864824 RepID=UPI00285CE833|nr:hypothetical protein [Siphonobacter sp. SORGH_AS_0500]MDR6193863.1 hypothetical protein [Siphonobacter sp. SORGH_AS_0500]